MTKHKILIVNVAQDSNDTYFADPINSLLRSESQIVPFQNIRSVEDTAGYDAIIISGQPPDDKSHTEESVAKNYGWVRDVTVPLFGFCGGHQIIAISYGAQTIKDTEAEPKGYFAAYAESEQVNDPVFAGIHFGRCNTFIVYNKHNDAVTLPQDFELMASTDRCHNAMMKHRNKPIYGAQFHPEDPDYYRRTHGINQHSNQDSDTVIVNFESLLLADLAA